MTYKISNSAFLLQPTEGEGQERDDLGLDGTNRTIYVPVYTFEIGWDIMSFTEFKQIYDVWKSVANAGTVTVTLPTKGGATYDTFTDYTNCVPDEPEHRAYFQKHYLKVVWRIRNIVVP